MPAGPHRRTYRTVGMAGLVVLAAGFLSTAPAMADDSGEDSDTGPVSYGQRSSSTWAGYSSVRTTPFRHVTASWRQPTTSCSAGPNSKLAVWAGIDGDGGSGTVLQGGTTVDCRNGQPNYRAWFQFYQGNGTQSPPQYLDDSVDPGDIISVTVTVDADNYGSVNVTNYRSGGFDDTWDRYFEVPDYNGTLTSAEAIVEAPSSTITDFGNVHFFAVEIDQAPLEEAAPDKLSLVRSGANRITCSDLRTDDFDCTWLPPA